MGEPLFQHLEMEGEDACEPDVSVAQGGHSRAVAEYLSDMIGQLESMARNANLDLLVYLLSMARVEAETSARTLVDEPQRTRRP